MEGAAAEDKEREGEERDVEGEDSIAACKWKARSVCK